MENLSRNKRKEKKREEKRREESGEEGTKVFCLAGSPID